MNGYLNRIYKSSLRFLYPLTAKETYKIIAEEAKKNFDADYASVFLARGEVLCRVYSDVPASMQTEPRRRGLAYKAYKNGKLYVHTDKSLKTFHPELTSKGTKSLVMVPLAYKANTMGVLTLMCMHQKKLAKDRISELQLFGSMASLSIRKTQLYQETKKALETRDLFIAMASHEFKTPLTTIGVYIQMIKKQITGSQSPASELVQELESETTRLTNLINEFLKVEQIGTGKLRFHFRKIRLSRVIEKAIISFTATHPNRKIQFTNYCKNKDDTLKGDFDKLIQVVINLLNNAAKFSSSDTQIDISMKITDGHAVLEIKDRGIGIPAKDIRRIFDEFYKGNAEKEGMGLGLYLTKRIIHSHNGNVSIKSKVNFGTTIEVKLPLLGS
jgi:signal transduction histidine kinase